MKIIHILPGNVWGGAEQYGLDFGQELERRGHLVKFLCRDANVVKARLEREGVDFSVIDEKNHEAIRGLIADSDIVHLHSKRFIKPFSKAISSLESKPKLWLTRHEARASRVTFPFRSRYCNLSGIIFVSKLSHDLWKNVNAWFPEEKCHTVLNSVAPFAKKNLPSELTLRGRYNIAPDTPLLVLTGRIRHSKGCETVINALSMLRDRKFEMVFVGNCKPAGYAEKLMKIAEKNGIADKIHFYGFSDNVSALIKEADIGLQPSIVRESCCLSAMEFMQAGKPVVTTRHGAQPEYIIDGFNGFLVDKDDAVALSHVIENLLESADLRCRIGENAAKYFNDQLSYRNFVDKIENIYKN